MGARLKGALRSRMAGMMVGSSMAAALLGCSAEAPFDASTQDGSSEENLGSSESQLTANVSDPAAYLTACWDNNVPKPPLWGRDNIGTGKNWLSRGPLRYEENYLGIGSAEVYFANPPQKNGQRGVCVIAAHNNGEFGTFDIICQGSTGKACFWEGGQKSGTDAPTPSSIDLLGPGWGVGGGRPILPPNPTSCTNCHTGQNAFITHANAGSALAPPTSAEIAARPGLEAWMPASYGVDPLGSAPDGTNLGGSNPPLDPLTSYGPSSSGCPTCHTSAALIRGGSFPLLTTAQIKQDSTFCSVISAVTNRPGSLGGMPPGNTCTPGMDCAQQTDQFVKNILAACAHVADAGGSGATPAFARDIHPATPFLFNTPSPHEGVHLIATSQNGQGDAFLAKWIYKFSNDGWGLPANTLPPESSTTNFFTLNRPSGYLKNGTNRSFVVTSYAAASDGFGQIGDVYERSIDVSATKNVTNGAFTPRGQPAPLYRVDGYNSIYVSDQSGWLHQFDWGPSSTSWSGNYNLHDFGQQEAAKSSPMAYNGIDNSIVVNYQCGSRSACEMRYNFAAGQWQQIISTSPVNLVAGTRPTALLYGSKQYVFFTTTSGLYAAIDATGSGYAAPTRISTSTSRFFSSPMPYVRGDGKLEVLINYTDSLGAQNLYAYTLSSGVWSVASLFSYTANGVAPVVGDPVGYVRNVSGNRNGAVFLDASRNLKTITQATAGGGWGFETSPNHDLASVLIAAGAWKRYVP